MAVNVPHEFTQHQLCFVAPLSELLDLFRGEVGFLLRAIKQSLDSLETPSLVDRCIHLISVRGEEQSVVLVDSCLSLSLVFCGLLLVELSHPVSSGVSPPSSTAAVSGCITASFGVSGVSGKSAGDSGNSTDWKPPSPISFEVRRFWKRE